MISPSSLCPHGCIHGCAFCAGWGENGPKPVGATVAKALEAGLAEGVRIATEREFGGAAIGDGGTKPFTTAGAKGARGGVAKEKGLPMLGWDV